MPAPVNDVVTPDEPSGRVPFDAPPDTPRSESSNVLLLSVLAFTLVIMATWLVSAGERYRDEYARATESWRVGTTRSVELTLVREDKTRLGCASDQVIAGLRCGTTRSGKGAASADETHLLQPYNTVGNQLLLGAGLWNSSDLKGALPRERFSVTCDYDIKGVARSVAIRFDPAAPFVPVDKTVMVGTLRNCVLPR